MDAGVSAPTDDDCETSALSAVDMPARASMAAFATRVVMQNRP